MQFNYCEMLPLIYKVLSYLTIPFSMFPTKGYLNVFNSVTKYLEIIYTGKEQRPFSMLPGKRFFSLFVIN